MARLPTNSGGGGGTDTRTDSDSGSESDTETETESSTEPSTEEVNDALQSGPGAGDSPVGGGSVDDGSDTGEETDSGTETGTNSGSSTPDDALDRGPGPADSPTGGGTVDDSTDSDGGGSSGGTTNEPSSPPDDAMESGPGPGDSPVGGGSVDDGGNEDPADQDDQTTDQPREDALNEGPAGNEPDTPDYRSGPGRNPGGESTTEGESDGTQDSDETQGTEEPQGGDDGIVSLAEQYYVEARDHLDGEDVRVSFEDGEGNLELTASGAAATYAANNEGVDESDVTATRGEDGGWQIQFSDEYRQEQLEENYERGPRGASEVISGESGIADEGSPEDPLEGTGLEAGFGATARAARDLEDRVTENAGDAGGRVDPGESPEITDEDVEVVMTDDGTLELRRARDTLTAEQAQNIDDGPEPAPQDVSQLERETTSGVTPDYTTAAVNRAEQQVRDQLREQGVDPENVNVETTIEDGEVRAEVTESESEGGVFETLDSAGEDVSQVIENNAPEGAVALGSVPIAIAGQVSEPAQQAAVNFYESTFTSGAEVANVPRAVVDVRDAGQFAAYGAGEVAAGRGGEFAQETADAAVAGAISAGESALENPASASGTVVGSLVSGSAVFRGTRGAGAIARDIDGSDAAAIARQLAKDNRGQAQIPQIPRGRGSSDSDRVELTDEDLDVDPLDDFDEAAERQQFRESQVQRRLEQREEFEERTPDPPEPDPDEYVAPSRGGDYVSPADDYRTVSRGPDTSRSGPTDTQTSAWSSGRTTSADVDLSPRQRQLAAQLDPATDDLRRLDALERQLTDIDAGEGASGITIPSTFAPGVVSSTATVSGLSTSTGVDSRAATDSVLNSLGLTEGLSEEIGSGSAVDSATGTGVEESVGSGLDEDVFAGTGTDVAPATDTGIAVDSMTDLGSDTALTGDGTGSGGYSFTDGTGFTPGGGSGGGGDPTRGGGWGGLGGGGGAGRRRRFGDDDDDDEDETPFSFEFDDEIFDTGVVQSFSEL